MKKIIVTLFVLAFCGLGFSQDEMNYEEEYLPRLQKAQEEIEKLEADISEEESEIASTENKISETESKIEQIWDDIYTMLETDEAGVDGFRKKLEDLDNDIRSFGALPSEELYRRRAELDQFEEELNSLSAQKVSALTEFVNKIQRIDQRIKSVRSSIVVPYVTSYVVKKGDNLWKISGKKDIYDDPFKWTDIYKANQQTISSWQKRYNAVLKEGQQEADLIYPDQEFTIPR
ncbi:MAG: LysM peptidoglycan-binding domain-containing protein [Candidatus Delongbacteria bacterium]